VKSRCLLDVNVLVSLLWEEHSLHARANAWFAREKPEVHGCVFTELSFLRVSMADKTIAASFADAQAVLAQFIATLGSHYHFIDRLPPASLLQAQPVISQKQVSDWYLCELAKLHGLRLATLDAGIKHPQAVLIA
jgi:predicted nucleic acid-binding protein